MHKGLKGSVLLEFLIVLPIYMLLLGFAFVTGELALQAIHLAGGADRTLAMNTTPSAFGIFKRAISPHDAYDDGDEDTRWDADSTWKEDDQIFYEYSGDPEGGSHQTTKFEGQYGASDGDRIDVFNTDQKDSTGNPVYNPENEALQKCLWTKTVAAYVANAYTLIPVTRGFIAFWRWDVDQKLEAMGDAETLGDDMALPQILDSGIGRAAVVGKDLHQRGSATALARQYGYYSLQRNDRARTNPNRYRAADAGALASNDKWKNLVYLEEPARGDYEDIDAGGDGETGELPEGLGTVDIPQKVFPDTWTR